MDLYKRFLLVIAAVMCAAGAVCGVIVARANTERRLYGAGEIRQNTPITEEAADYGLPSLYADHRGSCRPRPPFPFLFV